MVKQALDKVSEFGLSDIEYYAVRHQVRRLDIPRLLNLLQELERLDPSDQTTDAADCIANGLSAPYEHRSKDDWQQDMYVSWLTRLRDLESYLGYRVSERFDVSQLRRAIDFPVIAAQVALLEGELLLPFEPAYLEMRELEQELEVSPISHNRLQLEQVDERIEYLLMRRRSRPQARSVGYDLDPQTGVVLCSGESFQVDPSDLGPCRQEFVR